MSSFNQVCGAFAGYLEVSLLLERKSTTKLCFSCRQTRIILPLWWCCLRLCFPLPWPAFQDLLQKNNAFSLMTKKLHVCLQRPSFSWPWNLSLSRSTSLLQVDPVESPSTRSLDSAAHRQGIGNIGVRLARLSLFNFKMTSDQSFNRPWHKLHQLFYHSSSATKTTDPMGCYWQRNAEPIAFPKM